MIISSNTQQRKFSFLMRVGDNSIRGREKITQAALFLETAGMVVRVIVKIPDLYIILIFPLLKGL